MKKRQLTEETKNKILLCAANILSMHGEVAGSRVCQDWSGKEENSPEVIFTSNELNDLSFNYEINNSDGNDYMPDYNGMGDEMVASFTLAQALRDMAQNTK